MAAYLVLSEISEQKQQDIYLFQKWKIHETIFWDERQTGSVYSGCAGVDNLKKPWRLLSITLLLAGTFLNLSPSLANGISFQDVSADFWGNEAIQWAVDNKIIDGYPDGTFKPNQNVDQNEFLAMLIRAYRQNGLSPNNESSDWAQPYITYAGKMGWSLITTSPPMEGQTNHNGLSRWIVAKYLTNATGRNYNADDSIRYLLDIGMTEGKMGKTIEGFNKSDQITRSEAVAFIQRLRQKYNQLHSSPAAEEKYISQNIIYENAKFNFTLKIPKPWQGKYEVVNQIFEDVENVDFFSTANKAYGGLLFTIQIMPKKAWSEHGEELMGIMGAHISKIGETDDKVYLLVTPTDVEFVVNDEKLKAEYDFMFNDIETIKASFDINNG